MGPLRGWEGEEGRERKGKDGNGRVGRRVAEGEAHDI